MLNFSSFWLRKHIFTAVEFEEHKEQKLPLLLVPQSRSFHIRATGYYSQLGCLMWIWVNHRLKFTLDVILALELLSAYKRFLSRAQNKGRLVVQIGRRGKIQNLQLNFYWDASHGNWCNWLDAQSISLLAYLVSVSGSFFHATKVSAREKETNSLSM